MRWHRKDEGPDRTTAPPRHHMRVLRGPAELAEAEERAAEGQRRLRAQLDARAAHEARTAERHVADAPELRTLLRLRAGALPPPLGTRRPPLAGPPASLERPPAPPQPSSHHSPAA